ncbi:MAG: exonuclease domain-containing protein [Rhodospirillales bacterium]
MKLSSIGEGNIWVVYDLECTAWPGSSENGWSKINEYREIIQIGAVKFDISANLAEIDSCVIHVKPKINPILSDYIINLTGISQKTIEDSGLLFPEAAKKFKNFF